MPAALTAVVILVCALVTVATRVSRASVALLIASLAAAGWEVSCAFLMLAGNESNATWWARIGCAFAVLLAPAMYQFVENHRKPVLLIAWLIAIEAAALSLTTNLVVKTVLRHSWGYYPVFANAAAILFPLFCLAIITIALVEHPRMWLAIASLAVVDFIPAYSFGVFPFGSFALLIATGILAYKIRKHGLPATAPSVPATEIISTMRDLLLVSDREGRIRFANNAACTFLGYAQEDIVGKQLEDVIAPADGNAAVPLQGWVRDREYLFRSKMGQPIELTLSHSPITAPDGEVTGAVIIGRDLRERKKYEWEARRAVTLLQSTLDSTADGILVIGHDGRVLTWNQRFADMWGIPPEQIESNDGDQELIGLLVQQLTAPAEFLDTLAALYEHPEDESTNVLRLKDGRRLEQYSIGRYLDEEPVRVWSFRDVTARLEAEEQIEFQAYHDALTQLPNRRLFVERLEITLLNARRARSSAAVLFIDLDRFKAINDTLGHDVADGLLIEIAKRLKSCVRQTDTVARHGGDEFTILLADLHQPEDAAQVAEKILERVADPAVIGTHSIEISVSIGIAVFPYDGADMNTLLRNADDAMYRAKQAGRNNYQLCTEEMKLIAMERSSMQTRLKKAMENGELVLAYEPQVSLTTGRVVGAEAVIRWNDPERGTIEPRDFIPIAEETRLIVPLGEWTLLMACQQLRRWIQAGLPAVRIAVNISSRQFQQRDLSDVVRRAISEAGIEPSLLELEIHETTAMRDINLTIELLNLLRETGVTTAMDDFGSSYSSLGSLRVLPINAVKMDRGLIENLTIVDADESIVSAVIGVGRRLELRVSADGVETRAQHDFLKEHGCHEAQGTYFTPAVDAEDFAVLMASGVYSQ